VADSGLLVIDKPGGVTSHDVVARVRRILGTRKVGHAGTLDPMATGVLVIGVDRATRLLGHLALRDKEYTATIRLGSSTVTDDREGVVLTSVGSECLALVTDAQIATGLVGLVGTIAQRPSAVSAIKVDGRRAYDRVRAGEQVDLPAREVTIARIDVGAITRTADGIDVAIEVECSTGTYIRALARDLGESLDVGGHLVSLRRTRVGPFGVDQALALDDLMERGPSALLSMPAIARVGFPTWVVGPAQARAVRLGQRIDWAGPSSAEPTAILDEDGEFLALSQDDAGLARYLAVFARPEGADGAPREA
jgi:tRNA pseudouridine55 synthase